MIELTCTDVPSRVLNAFEHVLSDSKLRGETYAPYLITDTDIYSTVVSAYELRRPDGVLRVMLVGPGLIKLRRHTKTHKNFQVRAVLENFYGKLLGEHESRLLREHDDIQVPAHTLHGFNIERGYVILRVWITRAGV